MTMAEAGQRIQQGWTKIRPHLTRRRVLGAVLLVALASTVGITGEALLRAHLGDPDSRLPTAYYTRPVGWSSGSARQAVSIGAIAPDVQEYRVPVTIDQVPATMVQAVLAVEDQRFYQHHGLDLKRIAGAAVADIKSGSVVEGGSTLTQQLAKNLFLTSDRTPLRKLREAAMALVLEARYSKNQILEAYLNEAYFGQDGLRAIRGVGAASRYYFGHDLESLTLPEAALLAGMIRSPNRLAPTRHADDARLRRDLVLGLMASQGRISNAEMEGARLAGVSSEAHSPATIDGRYFRDYLTRSDTLHLPTRGAAIYTTLDATLQRSAERSVQWGLQRIRKAGAQASLVALDPRTGDILAMVGGDEYGATQYNRATDALRQPGSAFKPLVALAALERGRDKAPTFTLASMVDDAPLSVKTPSGLWQPANYDGAFRGMVTLREALEQSLNVPFARIGLAVGPDSIAAVARRLGIDHKLAAVPSLALGSSEVTLLELVRAYGVFAAAGQLASTRSVLTARDADGRMHPGAEPTITRVADPAAAFLVTTALEGVVSRGTGQALAANGYGSGFAGKTGTSNDWRDSWFIAYSPSLVVGVWVGYDDGRSLGLTGAGAALPIVSRFLDGANADRGEAFMVPAGVVEGYTTASDDWSSCGEREYFLSGTEPANAGCDHGSIWGDSGRSWDVELGQRLKQLIGQSLLKELQKLRGVRLPH